MAAATINHEKRPHVSGETEFVDRITLTGGTSPDVVGTSAVHFIEIRIKKDVYDNLSAANKTAVDAITIADVLAATFK